MAQVPGQKGHLSCLQGLSDWVPFLLGFLVCPPCFTLIWYTMIHYLYIYIHMDECLYVSCTYRCVQFPGWERWALIPIDPTLIHGFGKGVENPPCVDHFPGVVVCEPIGTMMHHHGKTPGQLSVPVVWLRCRMVKLGDAQSLLQGESDYSKSFTCWQFKCSLLKTTMFNR